LPRAGLQSSSLVTQHEGLHTFFTPANLTSLLHVVAVSSGLYALPHGSQGIKSSRSQDSPFAQCVHWSSRAGLRLRLTIGCRHPRSHRCSFLQAGEEPDTFLHREYECPRNSGRSCQQLNRCTFQPRLARPCSGYYSHRICNINVLGCVFCMSHIRLWNLEAVRRYTARRSRVRDGSVLRPESLVPPNGRRHNRSFAWPRRCSGTT
jgi:hypothetical protein